MRLKEKVTRVPITFFGKDLKTGKSSHHPMSGTVFYIHPKGRYHVVEFETRGGEIREAFLGT